MADGHAAPTAGDRLGCLCLGPFLDLRVDDTGRYSFVSGCVIDQIQRSAKTASGSIQ